MVFRSYEMVQRCLAGLGLTLAFLCSVSLSAENSTLADAQDPPVEAKIPDVKSSLVKPVVLRYQFHPNQFMHYEVVHKMVISLSAKEVTETTRNQSVSKQHLRVVSVDENGDAVIEPTLDHVRMRSQFDDNPPTLFDSDDVNQQPQEFEKILESIGEPQGRQRVDATGKIIAERDTTESMNTVALLMLLPQEPVKVGATWDDDYTVRVRATQKLERSIKLRRKFTFTQLDGDIAVIDFKTLDLDNPQDPQIRVQLIQMTPSGTIRFDIRKGMIVSKTMHSNKVEYEVAGGAMHAISDRTETLVTPKK
ncbi:MAG: hypothetical protein O2955_10040 [Planctomycetota bacterium]|nr:hypothetical protein [Planctomycetota bacterium]MDA1212851.1 hypothetical protein [Planctomycetota bacterium]